MPAASREFFWFAFKDTKHRKGLLFGREGPGMESWLRAYMERLRRGNQQTWVQILALISANQLCGGGSRRGSSDLNPAFLICKLAYLHNPSAMLVHRRSLINIFTPTAYSVRGMGTDPQTSHIPSPEVTESPLASVWGPLCPLTKSADNHRS